MANLLMNDLLHTQEQEREHVHLGFSFLQNLSLGLRIQQLDRDS